FPVHAVQAVRSQELGLIGGTGRRAGRCPVGFRDVGGAAGQRQGEHTGRRDHVSFHGPILSYRHGPPPWAVGPASHGDRPKQASTQEACTNRTSPCPRRTTAAYHRPPSTGRLPPKTTSPITARPVSTRTPSGRLPATTSQLPAQRCTPRKRQIWPSVPGHSPQLQPVYLLRPRNSQWLRQGRRRRPGRIPDVVEESDVRIARESNRRQDNESPRTWNVITVTTPEELLGAAELFDAEVTAEGA